MVQNRATPRTLDGSLALLSVHEQAQLASLLAVHGTVDATGVTVWTDSLGVLRTLHRATGIPGRFTWDSPTVLHGTGRYCWTVRGSKARALLAHLRPYLPPGWT